MTAITAASTAGSAVAPHGERPMAMTVSTVQSACRAVRCSMTARRRDSASGTSFQRLACKMAGAAVRSQIAGQQAQQWISGAVRPDKRRHLAAAQRDGDVVDNLSFTKVK